METPACSSPAGRTGASSGIGRRTSEGQEVADQVAIFWTPAPWVRVLLLALGLTLIPLWNVLAGQVCRQRTAARSAAGGVPVAAARGRDAASKAQGTTGGAAPPPRRLSGAARAARVAFAAAGGRPPRSRPER